jgi:aryl-alcohol dehydrogenase-like predicted oxidoreductase
MHYRKLGSTGILAGEIGFGAWSLSLVPDDDAAVALVRSAVRQGANVVDVADVYQAGRCEALVGRALEGVRENAVVATKVGLSERDGALQRDFNPRRIVRAVQASRERLRSDYIDLLQLHYPTVDALTDPGLWEALAELRGDGGVKHIGVAADSLEVALAAVAEPRVETVQVVFNAVDAGMLAAIRRAHAAGKGVIARAPLLGGLLARRTHDELDPAASSREPLKSWPAERLRILAAQAERFHTAWPDDERMPAQAALGWVLAHPEVSVTIPGARTVDQLAENLATSDLPLPSAKRMAAAQHVQATASA